MQETDKRQQILEGALEVFSTQGFHKTSIKQIARAANIKSSALIYHYFEDKNALLNAVVNELTPVREIPALNEEMQEQLMQVPPEMLLQKVGGTFLSLLNDEKMRNLIRLFLSEAVRMPEVSNAFIETQSKLLRFLIHYLEHHQNNGTFREHNSETAARAFMGMIIANVMIRLVFTQLAEGMPDTETYVNEIVQIFLDGMRRQE